MAYKPREGTIRAQLYEECRKFEEEFTPLDFESFARQVKWSMPSLRSELQRLAKYGLLKRVDRGIYKVVKKSAKRKVNSVSDVEAVRKVAMDVAKKDQAKHGADRFTPVTHAVGQITMALHPLSPNERRAVLGVFLTAAGEF